jgi:hypothetical protein
MDYKPSNNPLKVQLSETLPPTILPLRASARRREQPPATSRHRGPPRALPRSPRRLAYALPGAARSAALSSRAVGAGSSSATAGARVENVDFSQHF